VVWDLPLQGDPGGPTSITSTTPHPDDHDLLHRNLHQRSWHTVVGIPHQDPKPPIMLLPRPVKAVQHDVGEQGACHPTGVDPVL
jgi:hypothetical protein